MKLVTPGEVPIVMAALKRLIEKSPSEQMRYAELIEAELGVRDAIHNNRAVFVGDFFIMFDVGKIWYSSKQFLIEELVIRVSTNHGTPVSEAVAALDNLAQRFRCAAVVAGDTQIGAMTNHYLRAGYVMLGSQFIKHV